MMAMRLIIGFAVLFLLASVAQAQYHLDDNNADCGISAEYSRPCEPGGGGGGNTGGGGGGGGGYSYGCQYCYTAAYAPYGNCYSADPQYGSGQLLANCQGTRNCWRDGFGNEYCEPACSGSPCYSI